MLIVFVILLVLALAGHWEWVIGALLAPVLPLLAAIYWYAKGKRFKPNAIFFCYGFFAVTGIMRWCGAM